MWLSGNHRLTITSILVITGIAGALLVSARNRQDAPEPSNHPGGFGTAEKAFDAAGREVLRYLSDNELGTFAIDPDFRSTLLGKSKIWIVKGYATCPDNDKVYQWTVIVNYDDMQNWEILAKTVVPISSKVEDLRPNRKPASEDLQSSGSGQTRRLNSSMVAHGTGG
jgi:hypothetical protein